MRPVDWVLLRVQTGRKIPRAADRGLQRRHVKCGKNIQNAVVAAQTVEVPSAVTQTNLHTFYALIWITFSLRVNVLCVFHFFLEKSWLLSVCWLSLEQYGCMKRGFSPVGWNNESCALEVRETHSLRRIASDASTQQFWVLQDRAEQ